MNTGHEQDWTAIPPKNVETKNFEHQAAEQRKLSPTDGVFLRPQMKEGDELRDIFQKEPTR